ncbi:MAG TPA: ECF-type sigma factor [Bryobacteraceae bacterium]|nr:ECF-type sigma factor [Bryobacteraceae bacterium]
MTALPDLLRDPKGNSPSASEPAFLELVYDELHRMASSLLRHERPAHTLQTSALVNEAFLRLSAAHSLRVEDRQHFLRIAAHSMREILIDYARSRHTQKRDGLTRVDLDACQAELVSTERTEEFVALDAALDRLAKMDARQAQIVELRFFAGLSVEETAANLGISEKTVKRDWSVARAWLRGAIEGGGGA